jgi:hypothetical protein
MSELSSDSSDSDQDPVNTVENEKHELTLNAVNDCIREYEKEQKKERKKRFDAKGTIQQAEIPVEALQTLTLTKKQLAQLKALNKKEETEKQKEAKRLAALAREEARAKARITADLRKDKGTPGILMKVAQPSKPRGMHARKPKAEVIEEEEEEEEAPPPKSFQARKPKLEEEIEEKVQKLSKLDAMINGNPYYAMIMAQRQGRRN